MPVTATNVDPKNVLDSLSRHMLVDGYHIVMDLRRSKGHLVYDSLHDVEILDLFSHFATVPVGYNHPKMVEKEFLEQLGWVAVTKPANSDIYTEEMAEFVETFSRVAIPEMRRHGYDAAFAAGAVASAGTLDVLIPPSVLIAIYAIVAEQSLVQLYAAAFIPGFVLAGL